MNSVLRVNDLLGQRYERFGAGYAQTRRTEPRIEASIREALGDVRSVANVGAGTGSYEPDDLQVVAIEPSRTMAAQRPPERPALIAPAESIPLKDDAVDAAMAVITVHHWSRLEAGISEMRRVARRRIVVLTLDPEVMQKAWTREYWPELSKMDREFPPVAEVASLIGDAEVTGVPVPADCADLYIETLKGRPELLLDPRIRANCSGFARMDDELEVAGAANLSEDLASGVWDRTHGWLREQTEFDGGLRLIVGSV